jgi:hypothetical protein
MMEEDRLIKELEAAIERGETVEDVAKRHGLKVIDATFPGNGLLLANGEPDMAVKAIVAEGYYADDGNADVYYSHADSGKEAAQEYMDEGDWGPDSDAGTWWHEVRTWRAAYAIVTLDEDDEPSVECIEVDEDYHTIEMEPEEPECAEDSKEHDWCSPYSVLGGIEENPGVYGHGGGVVSTEVCSRCGRYRTTDTWAQNPCNGQQGLTSIAYRDADEASSDWVESLRPEQEEEEGVA